ncbi:flippase [Haloferax volcanii]|uniref:Flippase n=1 Tax=Haloferax volcanii TaxID=2246 RepID=A0A558GAG9_HALVO|nr:flippase [Haloferax volcanii]TVT94773.1 flippase [Haloferax volcanii]
MEIKDSFEELLTGAGVSFIGIVLAQGLTLGSEVLFANLLGPRLYGQIGLAASIGVSLATIISLGLPQGIARLWRTVDTDVERQSLLISSYLLVSGLCAIVLITFFTFPGQISRLINTPSISGSIPFFSVFIVFFSISLTTLGALRGMKQPTISTLSRDVFPKISGLIIFVLFVFLGQSYRGAVLFWVSSGVVSFISSSFFLWYKTRWNPISVVNAGFSKISQLWEFSWPLALEAAFMSLMINLDIILIGYFSSSSAVGFYRSVQPLSRGLTLFLGSFTFLYLPIATDYFNGDENNELKRIYQASTKWILFVTYPLALLFVFFSPEVVLTLFDERYLPAASALSILSIGMFLRAAVGPNGATVKAINKTKIDLIASLAGLLTNVALNVILIPDFGFIGAAVATSISFLIFNLVDSIVVFVVTGAHPLTINVFKQLIPSGIFAWYLSTTSLASPGILDVGLLFILLSISHIISYIITRSVDSDDQLIIETIEDKTGFDLNFI